MYNLKNYAQYNEGLFNGRGQNTDPTILPHRYSIKRNNIKENRSEIDPLGEEDWGDDDELNLVKIDKDTILKKGDEIWVKWYDDKFYGHISDIILRGRILAGDIVDEYTIRRFDGHHMRKSRKDLEIFSYYLRIKNPKI